MDRLTLTLNPDDDGTAELTACVEGDWFAGTGSAWFSIETLEGFCTSLAAYPIDPNATPFVAGGYWDDRGKKLKETHLAIHVVPYDSLGALQVSVQLC